MVRAFQLRIGKREPPTANGQIIAVPIIGVAHNNGPLAGASE
jgi:hypothetical protein